MENKIKIIDEFIVWMKDKYGYDYAIHRQGLPISVVIDFESNEIIGRFTVWSDLSSMSEVMDIKTSKYRIDERNEFSDFYDLKKIFVNFISFLS